MESNSDKIQKIVRDFDRYFENKKHPEPEPPWPELEPPEPCDLHEILKIDELRAAINKKRVKQGKVKFV